MTNEEILQKVIDENIEKYVAGRLKSLGVQIVKCKKCKKEMFWLTSKNGKAIPTCLNLTNHFADCKFAKDFRKK